MSVIGFDIGNENCVIAAAKRGGIDVLLNDEAKRESPGVVSFGDKQRFMGSAGAAFATANAKSTISQIKRLIGRQYNEPSVQEELKLLPFVTSEGPRGGIMIELEYMKEKLTFTPVEILGMLFKHLKQIAEKNLESPVLDCVIGIPSYFTDLQRREYLDAAFIAGLNTLLLMHDGTAIALGYGMYKTDLSDKGPTIVVFVDIGQCDTQVTVAAFDRGGMKVQDCFPYSIGIRLDEGNNIAYKTITAISKCSPFPVGETFPNFAKTAFYFHVSYINKTDLPAGVSPKVGLFMMPLQHKMKQLKAQENKQKLLEQDKKVEQTKDQRNTLESFVYDTRSKLQNAYKRFVTDSENEGIIKSLQETEDWLYEDSDDECEEQIYTGKLEDLKKLLEPIENRYKDENKVQATKPLLAMIEEYHLVADSLPVENKMELENACAEVEQHLSGHSPENYDQIGWSNFIKKTMDKFKRICDAIEKKVQATKPLLAMIEEHRLLAHSLPLENKKEASKGHSLRTYYNISQHLSSYIHPFWQLENACAEVEQHLSGHPPENYNPIDWSNFIKNTMDIFKSFLPEVAKWVGECEEAMQYKPSEHPGPVESDRSCNHMDFQTGNPMDAKQTGKSMDANQTGKPVEGNQTSKPVKPDHTRKPVKPEQTSKPVKPDQTSKPVKRVPKQAKRRENRTQGKPTLKPTKRSQTLETTKQATPWWNKLGKTCETGHHSKENHDGKGTKRANL
ncbi:heat shock 70 kDa protein 16-like protein [Tanacetum coccineum]|uniref:Heat shock 70 kDa protein 16-like protein n=1 Tax=Tanacetum coccineum TaxID=301880 RepID=A0ABQ5G7H7_9ASTR